MGLRAEELRDELRPSIDGEKTVLIKMSVGKRPDVIFTGTWSGKYIKGAIDSIAKAYRVQGREIRRTGITPTLKVEKPETQLIAEGGK